MATLRIPFPDGTKTLTLRGRRITIGRLPDNVIQVRDLTVSGRHAELIAEDDGHYRIHDAQSTNGVFINGEQVADFHLTESCKVRLGSLECEFAAGAEADEAEGESVPTHIEMRTLKQANDELKAAIEALRSEAETMRKARGEGAEGAAVEKFDQLAAEMSALRTNIREHQTQMDALRSQLAVVTRERDNLQRGYDDLRATTLTATPTASKLSAPAIVANPAAQAEKAPPTPLTPDVALQSAAESSGQATVALSPKPAPTTPSARPPTVPLTPPAVPAAAPKAPGAPLASKPTGMPTVPGAPAPAAAPVGAPKPPMPPRIPPGAPIGRPAAPVAPAAAQPQPTGLPKAPGALGATTPVRRPPSAIQAPPAKPIVARPMAAQGAATGAAGPKGTEKLVD